ncbi:MAG TPA: AAA family ATPase [Candidatus Bathyarchaeia archaeon]|nr:AAA family ATPase [Candidatus Bathyarchaeia archaeon]
MLSDLYVANFKSIGDNGVEIQPKPLTILTGPNGAGKSSILEALCLLSQSIGQAQFNIHSGDYVRYASPQSFVHKGELSRLLQISLTLDRSLDVDRGLRSPGMLIRYRYDPAEALQTARIGGNDIATMEWDPRKSGTPTYNVQGFPQFQHHPGVDPRAIFHSNIFGISVANSQMMERLRVAQSVRNYISNFLQYEFFFISAFRGASKFYLDSVSGPDPSWVGTDGSMTNHILSRIWGSREYDEAAAKISKWAETFSLGGMKAGWAGAARLSSGYVEPQLKNVIETSLASHGSRQALTFITQIFWSKRGTTPVIEEPEISLHPESQTLLPSLFAEAVSRGVQIIVTTHSPFLSLSLWKPISEKTLSAKDIAVYHFEKRPEGSSARKLEVSPEGRLREWIPSFSATETKLLKEFLDDVPTE